MSNRLLCRLNLETVTSLTICIIIYCMIEPLISTNSSYKLLSFYKGNKCSLNLIALVFPMLVIEQVVRIEELHEKGKFYLFRSIYIEYY